MVIRLAEAPLHTKFGTFLEILYYDGQQESIAIVMGDVREGDNVLCRLHSHCISAHLFNQYFGQNLGCLISNDAIVTKRFVIRAGFFQTLPVG
jgi:GTP cyclohydrolase II